VIASFLVRFCSLHVRTNWNRSSIEITRSFVLSVWSHGQQTVLTSFWL